VKAQIRFVYSCFLWGFVCSLQALSQQDIDNSPCPTISTILITQFKFGSSITELPRVELRQCGAEQSLQIVAWKEKEKAPSLIIDTTDFTVVQVAARSNAFLIETTGGSRDFVFVIIYKNGSPTLALKSVTKDTATVEIHKASIDISVSGIYAGDREPRAERFSYKLSLDDLFRK
jgi:hypothetical protein